MFGGGAARFQRTRETDKFGALLRAVPPAAILAMFSTRTLLAHGLMRVLAATARERAPAHAPASAVHTPGRALLLAVPALLTVHNLEELLAMPRVLPSVAERMPDAARGILPAVTLPMFAAALAVATVLPWIVAGFAVAGRRTALYLLLVIQATMLVNVASHVVSAVVLGGYAPGLATALALNLPFGIHLLARARRERWIGRRAWNLLFPLALLVHGPVIIGLLWIGARITGAS